MSATRTGLVASAFQILSLLGAFGVPVLARWLPLGHQLIVMGLLWLITPAWMLLAPGAWPLWTLTGGITQGGTFVVIFMLIMHHAGNLDDNRRLSALVQGIGYSLSSLGPIGAGLIHEMSGDWTSVFVALALLSLVIIIIGVALAKVEAASPRVS